MGLSKNEVVVKEYLQSEAERYCQLLDASGADVDGLIGELIEATEMREPEEVESVVSTQYMCADLMEITTSMLRTKALIIRAYIHITGTPPESVLEENEEKGIQ